MKILIASDLHGSCYYVNLLVQRIRQENPERVVLLGDLLYHGPRNALPRNYDTQRTAELLNVLVPSPLCVRGNCDAEVDQMLLSFPIFAEWAILESNGKTAYCTHGHHLDSVAPLLKAGDIVFSGHTHVPDYHVDNNIIYVNPGSVSIPKGGSVNSYIVWEEDALLWKQIETGAVWKQETI